MDYGIAIGMGVAVTLAIVVGTCAGWIFAITSGGMIGSAMLVAAWRS